MLFARRTSRWIKEMNKQKAVRSIRHSWKEYRGAAIELVSASIRKSGFLCVREVEPVKSSDRIATSSLSRNIYFGQISHLFSSSRFDWTECGVWVNREKVFSLSRAEGYKWKLERSTGFLFIRKLSAHCTGKCIHLRHLCCFVFLFVLFSFTSKRKAGL